MNIRIITIFLVAIACFTLTANAQDTNTRKSCFDDYNYMFNNRGTEPVPDGMQNVTISIVDANGKARCSVGEIMVKDNTIIPPLYIKNQDGSKTQTRGTFDRNFYRETSGKVSFGITNAMSVIFMLEGKRKARLYFIDYLKPEPGQPVKAPDMNSHITIDTLINKEELALVNENARNINFETARDVLNKDSYAKLDAIAQVMLQHPDSRWIINGYTDNSGNEKSNLELSGKRANAVQRYLIMKGVKADHLYADGHGSDDPIADNNTAEGRALNRRVEIIPVK